MKRNAMQSLVEWKQDKRRKPLIVMGRRTGWKNLSDQGYLCRDLLQKTIIFIWIARQKMKIRDFCLKTANAKKIIEYISLRRGKQITENHPC